MPESEGPFLMEDLTGKQLGSYQIVAPLGEGGMAAVYKAFQPSMNRYVALKILPRHLAGDPQFVARFQQEAKVLAQLQHPHVLPIHDFGEADGYTYLVMPFVEGGTLVGLMKGQPLPLPQVRRIISQVGDALDYAHSAGLVHRDVKPSNVLIDKRGNCLLTDFGIAKIVEGNTRITTTGGIVGTPAYMSPEQGLGYKLDGRSDQYSLGVILYELATGRAPYNAETPMAVVIKHINDPLPPPRTLNPELPNGVERIILRSLAKNPADRYPSVGEMVQALQAAIPETGSFPAIDTHAPTVDLAAPTKADGVAPVGDQPRPARRTWLFVGLGAVLLAVLAGVFALLGGGGATQTAAATQTDAAIVALPTETAAPPTSTRAPSPQPATPTDQPSPAPTEAPTIEPTAGPTATPALGLGSTQVAPQDGMVLVYVPAGPFLMGSADSDTSAGPGEKPQREVTLDAFWIDRTEVTNAQHALCVAAGACRRPPGQNSATHIGYYSSPEFKDYPVLYVTWQDAKDYCAWAGRRLPTEAEWEKAARGTDGRLYPWGDGQPNQSRTNFNSAHGDTAAVGGYADNASPPGAMDMAGNVWEWVADWYQGPYYATAPDANPLGPDSGTTRVLRGGAWNSDVKSMRAANRFNSGPTKRDNNLGFRCAR